MQITLSKWSQPVQIGTVTARNTKQWRKTQPCVPQWRTIILTVFFQLFLSALIKWQLWYGHPKSRLVWSGHHLYDQVWPWPRLGVILTQTTPADCLAYYSTTLRVPGLVTRTLQLPQSEPGFDSLHSPLSSIEIWTLANSVRRFQEVSNPSLFLAKCCCAQKGTVVSYMAPSTIRTKKKTIFEVCPNTFKFKWSRGSTYSLVN